MSKYTEIFEFMRKCPQLANLWSIGATEKAGVNVILPQGASPAVQYQEQFDTLGNYECEIIPYPSVYEDFQINCFRFYDSGDSSAPGDNINVMSLDEVRAVCEWVFEQNENGNLPRISSEKVVSIECNPFVPQIRAVNSQENMIAYFITVRIRYVNKAQRKSIVYECTD